MKKTTYLRKYEETILVKKADKSKVKEAKKTASKLKAFLKVAALNHLRAVEGIDLEEEAKRNGKNLEFKLDANPSGTVTIQLSGGIKQFVQIYHVQKHHLFAM